jgi:hypothetical protein
VLPLPDSKRAAGRRIAEALLDPLVRGVRAAKGRAAAKPVPAAVPAASPAAAAIAEPPAPARPAGEEAAARIDAARERLRATIAPPADDDHAPPA